MEHEKHKKYFLINTLEIFFILDNMGQDLFNYLNGTISILLVSKNKVVVGRILDIFHPIYVYKIKVVNSIEKAKEQLNEKRYHICFFDSKFHNVGIIKDFPLTFFVITVCDEIDCHAAFELAFSGAKILIDQNDFDEFKLPQIINRLALINLVNPKYEKKSKDRISIATKELIEKRPENSTKWSLETKITDRQMRNIWHSSFKVHTKIVISIFQLYMIAFEYFDAGKKSKDYDRLTEYFWLHKSEIEKHLNFGFAGPKYEL